jgi:hypothetical protein
MVTDRAISLDANESTKPKRVSEIDWLQHPPIETLTLVGIAARCDAPHLESSGYSLIQSFKLPILRVGYFDTGHAIGDQIIARGARVATQSEDRQLLKVRTRGKIHAEISSSQRLRCG